MLTATVKPEVGLGPGDLLSLMWLCLSLLGFSMTFLLLFTHKGESHFLTSCCCQGQNGNGADTPLLPTAKDWCKDTVLFLNAIFGPTTDNFSKAILFFSVPLSLLFLLLLQMNFSGEVRIWLQSLVGGWEGEWGGKGRQIYRYCKQQGTFLAGGVLYDSAKWVKKPSHPICSVEK